MNLNTVNEFIRSFYRGTTRNNKDFTPASRKYREKCVKFIKKLYNQNWQGVKFKDYKKERELNRVEERLLRLV